MACLCLVVSLGLLVLFLWFCVLFVVGCLDWFWVVVDVALVVCCYAWFDVGFVEVGLRWWTGLR